MVSACTQKVGSPHLEVISRPQLVYSCQFLGNGIIPLSISIQLVQQVGMSWVIRYLDAKLLLVPGFLLLGMQSINSGN